MRTRANCDKLLLYDYKVTNEKKKKSMKYYGCPESGKCKTAENRVTFRSSREGEISSANIAPR